MTVNDLFSVNGTPLTLINESGLYSLILTSKLPSAKEFKRWVTSEVLPIIRKTGFYSMCAKDNTDTTTPMRILTPDDYLSASRLIASCKSDRLVIILDLLSRGGWDLGNAPRVLTTGKSTADIADRLRTAKQKHGFTWDELAKKTGLDSVQLRRYATGGVFPKPARYEAIVRTLDSMDALAYEFSDCDSNGE